jgi:uncharacterized protein (TIGR03067 family)
MVVACLLAIVNAGAADDPKPAKQAGDDAQVRKQLCGLWRGYTVEGKGEHPDRGPVKLDLTITEKTMHGLQIKNDGNVDHGQGEYTLDLGAEPRRLDAAKTAAGGRKQEYIGIYMLEGDTLKWCVSPQKTRPTTFETVKGQFLLILKRAEPAK